MTPRELVQQINIARLNADVPTLPEDSRLSRTAALMTEWLVKDFKRRVPESPNDHVVSSKWLLATHPELIWERMYATFPGGFPDWFGAYNIARLCGYNGLALDNGAYVSKKVDPVLGWLRSEAGHRENLLDARHRHVGVHIGGSVGAGKIAIWAVFGDEP